MVFRCFQESTMPIQLPPISRRRFLSGSLAAGAGLLYSHRLPAAEKTVDPNRFVLLSDTHVREHTDLEHAGVNPAVQFAQAHAEYLQLDPFPAAALIAGDCVFIEGQPGDYATLVELACPVREAGLPIYCALGNHDHRENFWTAFPTQRPGDPPPVVDRHVSVIESPHANWILLDSLQRTNFTPGQIGPEQLAWLAAALDARTDKPALIVAHHNPQPGDTKGSGLQDTEALFDVLEPRRHVQAYFYGHSHRWNISTHRGIHLVNLPTLVWLFDKSQPRGWVDAQLAADGIDLELHSLDPTHPKHGEKVRLAWRG
jgi:3',5'-cyclic AMP phosphodiesterase CpdA